MENIIEIRNLTHTYSEGTPFKRTALDGVDLFIKKGEILGVIGHTGSGKSTLIQHLNGLLKPTSGEVLLDGQNIWAKGYPIRNVRFRVGLVFQYPEYQLFEETIARDIAFGPKNMGLDDAEVQKRVVEAMDFVGLSQKLAEKSPFELSGGQKRRVAIAGVIAMEPDILILDEPTAGLDPRGRDEILGHIRHLHETRGTTIVLVTHSMEDIATIADRMIVMKHGKVMLSGTPREVFSHGEALQAAGLNVPQITQVMMALNRRGIAIDPSIYTIEQAVSALQSYKAGREHHA